MRFSLPAARSARNLSRDAYFRFLPGGADRPELGIVDLFFALFGHTPLWMKLLLIVRNAIREVVWPGDAAVSEIMRPAIKSEYRVGDKIGPWPIYFIAEDELVAGAKQQASRFQIVGAEAREGDGASVIVTTVCTRATTSSERCICSLLLRSIAPEFEP